MENQQESKILIETKGNLEESNSIIASFFQFYFSNFREMVLMFFKSVPNIFSGFLSIFTLSIVLFFAGKINDVNAIAAIGMSNVWINLVSIAPTFSFNLGFLALGGQAFGEGDTRKVGILYQRAIFCNFIVVIPSFILLLFSQEIFSFLHIGEKIALYAIPYIYANIGTAFFLVLSDTTKTYLYIHGNFSVYTIILTTTTLLFFLLCIFFFYYLDLGVLGVGIARCLMEILNAILVFSYIKFWKVCQESWIPWTKEATKNIKSYYKTVFASGISFYMEWIIFEYLTLLSSLYGSYILAVNTIFMNLLTLFFTIPLGIGNTLVTFISSSIGAGDIKQTKYYVKMLFSCYFSFMVLIQIFIAIFFKKIISLFTDDKDLKDQLYNMELFFGYIAAFDGFPFALGTILRALGLQNHLPNIYLKSFYLIGIPLTIFLGIILDFKVFGWILGFNLSQITFNYCCYQILSNLDYQKRYHELIEELKSHSNLP